MNPTWNQPTYSMQSQLQLEHEFDLPLDANQNQQIPPTSLFPNSTYPPPQNYSFGFTTANGNVLSSGGQQGGTSRSKSYGQMSNANGSANERQNYLATTTESSHQQNFDTHSSSSRNGFNPTLPPYYNNQSYNIGSTQDPYLHQFGNQDGSGNDITATGLAENGRIPSPPFVTSPVREAFLQGSSTQELLSHPQTYVSRPPGIDTSGRLYPKRLRGEDTEDAKDEAHDESLPAPPHAKTKGSVWLQCPAYRSVTYVFH
jgi:hypothetical protein